jgi:hypothetical protein
MAYLTLNEVSRFFSVDVIIHNITLGSGWLDIESVLSDKHEVDGRKRNE